MFKYKPKKTQYMIDEENKKNQEFDVISKLGDLNLDFSFLKQILSDEDGKDFASINLKEEENKKNVLILLNTLKTLSPLLQKALLNYTDDTKKQTEYILKLNDVVIKQSKKFIEKLLKLDPEDKNNIWIINVLSSFFHSSIPDNLLIEEITENYFSDNILQALFYVTNENLGQSMMYNFPERPLSVGVQLCLIKALVPIINAQTYYDFYRKDKLTDLKLIIGQIINNCSKSLVELVLPSTTEKDKLMLFKLLLEESSSLFVNCWYETANKTIEFFKNNNMKTKDIKQKYPDGIPIEKIMENYNKNHNSLISLVKLVK